MLKHFPAAPSGASSLKNPAIQVFGNRLFSDQTVSELLTELLLVVTSPKRSVQGEPFSGPLPPESWFKAESAPPLEYAPKARLNLKLFAFLGASRLDSRHRTHRDHHGRLLEGLRASIDAAGSGDSDSVVRTMENLLLGFQGAGSGRTWCAQSFLPVSEAFIAGESIWNESAARREPPETWEQVRSNLNKYLTMNKHRFLGRGGELLYLQLCNALRQQPETISNWCAEAKIGLTNDERDPKWLRDRLSSQLNALMAACPATLTKLAEFIDTGVETKTATATDGSDDSPRWVSSGWCNAESWREGYLFAVELHRLLTTSMDAVERIYLLELACAMQVIRTLATQAERSSTASNEAVVPQYRLAASAPDDKRPAVRRLAQSSVKRIEKSIFQALRGPEVELPTDEAAQSKILKQADKAYGGKFFLGLAKRIGLVVPKRGAGARFVITEQLLRLFVVTIVPPGRRVTFDTFKQQLEKQHGLVFDADGLDRASNWLTGQGIYLPVDTDRWLREMLEAAGFLIHLSDSCALVHNPADARKDGK